MTMHAIVDTNRRLLWVGQISLALLKRACPSLGDRYPVYGSGPRPGPAPAEKLGDSKKKKKRSRKNKGAVGKATAEE